MVLSGDRVIVFLAVMKQEKLDRVMMVARKKLDKHEDEGSCNNA